MRDALDIHKDLIERSKNGERMAQKALFDRYSKAIYNLGIRLLGNKEDAADLTQDTFIEAFTKLDQFAYKATFGAWIKRIMVNRSINYLQRRKIFADLEGDLFEEEEYASDEHVHELMGQLTSSMTDLPEGCRVIFTLFYFEGYDHAEIASILQISESTSKSQLCRAKALLRDLITINVQS